MTQQEQKIYAFCNSNNVLGTNRSPLQLLFLYGYPKCKRKVKKKWTVQYPNIPPALCPVPHAEELLIPETP